jgi:carbonic anhydrase
MSLILQEVLAANAPANGVVEEVAGVRRLPCVATTLPHDSYVYDVKSGKLIEVPATTKAGRVG